MLQPQVKTLRQIEREERALARQALQQRAKELARKRAVDDFRTLLRHRYGSVIAGWRSAIDPDEEQVTWEVFEEAAKRQKFSGDLDGLWEELVAEDEEVLLLERLEPSILEARTSFLDACADRFGTVERAFMEMDLPEKPLIDYEDYGRICIEINMQKNRRVLFEYCDSKGLGAISLESIEPEVAKLVFGLPRCKEAEEQLMDREPRQTERKTIMRRAIEQCGATRRAPEEQRQRRQEIVDMLEERFDSPVRAWANLLDIHAKGKLKRLEFQTSMAVLGYTGNTNKLWEELGLKKKQSVRFKDLCPEVVEEIREFKNLAGKKIITLIQVSEVAAGPSKSKKAGAPVDNEEFYKVTDAIEYPGDPERLLRHLDPGSVGYVNTRTLRILNEQKSEEKAVPQFLKKYAEHRQALLDQKIASVVIPPAKELLAKQDTLRENCLEEWHTKREARNAKGDFIKALTNKFGSIAKAWRLALDPELKYAIENVDQLMKGLKRAGQMPPDGGEHALRTIAERLFQACQSKETEQITLDCLDPKTPAMMEKFKDRCEERFGSLQDAFESVDVEGVGIVSREDFRLLCHEVKATDGIFRLMEFLDPKRTGEIRLSLIDGEVTEDAMLATQTRRQMQKSQEHSAGVVAGLEQATQERAKRPARRALDQMKQQLRLKHGSLPRAWKTVHGSAIKDVGRDGRLRFFEHVGMDSRQAALAWELVPKIDEKLSLAQFEPRVGQDFEALRQKIKERYGSNIAMMNELDDGSGSMDFQRFLELCYECQFRGNERRVFEYLEEDETIDFERIDEKAAKELQEQKAQAKRREEEERRKMRRKKAERKAKKAKTKAPEPDPSEPEEQASLQEEEPPKVKPEVHRPKAPTGLGHLCLAMKSPQVKLGKTSSLPSLRIVRSQWNDRHHIADHIGNRDMNLIHVLTSVDTKEQEKCIARVRRKIAENPTMAWYEEQLRLEEERNAQIWAPDSDEGEGEEEEALETEQPVEQ